MSEFDAHDELTRRADSARRAGCWEPDDRCDLDTADGIVCAVCCGGAFLILVLVILGVIV
jgi:hypothetical protein